MVPDERPDRLAEKLPVVPATVCLLPETVGVPVVFQQIPRSIIVAPPSDETLPPDAAELMVILVAAVVEETVGIDADKVVNEICGA